MPTESLLSTLSSKVDVKSLSSKNQETFNEFFSSNQILKDQKGSVESVCNQFVDLAKTYKSVENLGQEEQIKAIASKLAPITMAAGSALGAAIGIPPPIGGVILTGIVEFATPMLARSFVPKEFKANSNLCNRIVKNKEHRANCDGTVGNFNEKVIEESITIVQEISVWSKKKAGIWDTGNKNSFEFLGYQATVPYFDKKQIEWWKNSKGQPLYGFVGWSVMMCRCYTLGNDYINLFVDGKNLGTLNKYPLGTYWFCMVNAGTGGKVDFGAMNDYSNNYDKFRDLMRDMNNAFIKQEIAKQNENEENELDKHQKFCVNLANAFSYLSVASSLNIK